MASSYIVYIHTSPSNKKYIGITKQSINRRWRNGNGYKRNLHFYSAIEKYGWDNFTHEIIISGIDGTQAKSIEQALIAMHKSNNKAFGYNATEGGDGGCGSIPNAETRRKMSESKRGEKHYLYGKKLSTDAKNKISEKRKLMYKDEDFSRKMFLSGSNSKKVYQYSTDGVLVKIWESRHQAEREFNSCKKSLAIGKCCNGKCKVAYGYFWTYNEIKSIDEIPKSKLMRKVYQYDKENNFVREWKNLNTVVNEFIEGKKSILIKNCVSNNAVSAYGYRWKYELIEKDGG